MLDDVLRRFSYLATLLGFTAAIWGVNILVSIIEVSFAPDEVYYHDIHSRWQINVTVAMAVVALVPLFVPSQLCIEGCAWLIAGSLANVFAASFWRGVPDYFSIGDHVINSADVTLTIGEGMMAVAIAVEVWRAFEIWRANRS